MYMYFTPKTFAEYNYFILQFNNFFPKRILPTFLFVIKFILNCSNFREQFYQATCFSGSEGLE